jgi:hypothetical protein
MSSWYGAGLIKHQIPLFNIFNRQENLSVQRTEAHSATGQRQSLSLTIPPHILRKDSGTQNLVHMSQLSTIKAQN